jgi:Ca2+-binding RTX toxin-like protein
MATIAGSQYDAAASAITYPGGVNVVTTSTGTGLPTAISNDFNLEIYTGPTAGAPSTPFSGYQALSILSPGGYELQLSGSGFAITDNGSTGGMLVTTSTATGDTITGGSGFDNLILNGSGNTANGGSAAGYIEVDGNGNTVNTGVGPQAVNVNSNNDTVNVGSGNNVISVFGSNTTVSGGTGADTITATGNNESITGGTGPELINATGTGTILVGGSGNDTLNVFGNGDTITGGSGTDVIGAYANNVLVTGGTGPSTVYLTGTNDTVTAGSGNMTINALNSPFQFNDSSNVYADTVVGFNQGSGDRIHLTTDTVSDALANSQLVNGGQDTLITLSDHSTILLKGITSINSNFFN